MHQKEIAHLYVEYAKKKFGKGPQFVRVTISDSVIMLDIYGTFTALEQSLLKLSADHRVLVKKIRQLLLKGELDILTDKLQKITGIDELFIKNYMMEFDYDDDHQVIVFFCNKALNDPNSS